MIEFGTNQQNMMEIQKAKMHESERVCSDIIWQIIRECMSRDVSKLCLGWYKQVNSNVFQHSTFTVNHIRDNINEKNDADIKHPQICESRVKMIKGRSKSEASKQVKKGEFLNKKLSLQDKNDSILMRRNMLQERKQYLLQTRGCKPLSLSLSKQKHQNKIPLMPKTINDNKISFRHSNHYQRPLLKIKKPSNNIQKSMFKLPISINFTVTEQTQPKITNLVDQKVCEIGPKSNVSERISIKLMEQRNIYNIKIAETVKRIETCPILLLGTKARKKILPEKWRKIKNKVVVYDKEIKEHYFPNGCTPKGRNLMNRLRFQSYEQKKNPKLKLTKT